DEWNGAWIRTRWLDTQLVPTAWRGRDDGGIPQSKRTNDSGCVDLWAPRRGYAIYLPERVPALKYQLPKPRDCACRCAALFGVRARSCHQPRRWEVRC